VQFGVGAIAAPVVGALGSDALAMAVVVAAGMLGALTVLLFVVRPNGFDELDAIALPMEGAAVVERPVVAVAH
jgi:DHA1 family bicyclomycin/chloramphenicol resistance-like MFS transporter